MQNIGQTVTKGFDTYDRLNWFISMSIYSQIVQKLTLVALAYLDTVQCNNTLLMNPSIKIRL